jgi:tRNA (guanine37-N1)-methyltransferase
MRFDIITLFPNMFGACPERSRGGPLSESIISRAQKRGLVEINLHNLRDYATDKHKTVDDTPYGGGAGMVLKVTVVDEALRYVVSSNTNIRYKDARDPNTKGILRYTQNDNCKSLIVLLTPAGQIFNQQKAIELSKYDNVILIAGHYEGFDQRIHDHLVDEELSIGEYVLTGGELPAMVVVDAVTRMIPGVIKEESAMNEPYMVSQKSKVKNQNDKIKCKNIKVYETREASEPKKLPPITYDLAKDFPVYTKPPEYKGWKVPKVLLSGNHAEIKKWRSIHTDFFHRNDTEQHTRGLTARTNNKINNIFRT